MNGSIAEIVELACEEVRDEKSHSAYSEDEELRAEVVEVGCELDEEVAKLMSGEISGNISAQTFAPNVFIDWRKVETESPDEPESKIKLIVQVERVTSQRVKSCLFDHQKQVPGNGIRLGKIQFFGTKFSIRQRLICLFDVTGV